MRVSDKILSNHCKSYKMTKNLARREKTKEKVKRKPIALLITIKQIQKINTLFTETIVIPKKMKTLILKKNNQFHMNKIIKTTKNYNFCPYHS